MGTSEMHIAISTLVLRLAILCLLFGQNGCYDAKPGINASEWQSDFHPIRIKLPEGWEVVGPLNETTDNVTVAIIDPADGCSLVIKITPDVSDDLVSNEEYFMAVREQMTSHASGNTLIDESEVQFENATFNRMRFAMNNSKFGQLFCQNLYTRRTGTLAIACQINYPIASVNELGFPEKIKSLLEGFELFDGAN